MMPPKYEWKTYSIPIGTYVKGDVIFTPRMTFAEKISEAVAYYLDYKKLRYPTELVCPLRSKYGFLSNMNQLYSFTYRGLMFSCVEQAYQYNILKYIGKDNKANEVLGHSNPVDMKRAGRGISIDEQVRIDFMREILLSKAGSCPKWKKRLHLTGTLPIVEGNWWKDNFWGVDYITPSAGRNELGQLLMEIRG